MAGCQKGGGSRRWAIYLKELKVKIFGFISHSDVIYSIRNVVNNILITFLRTDYY